MSEMKKQALGRGLSALFQASGEGNHEKKMESQDTLPIESIVPGRHQPRQYFSEEELEALSLSIREKGVLQPILVRLHPQDNDRYEIVAGERRWRASKRAGLQQIPVIIRVFSDAEALEVGLLENIQRQDLNPIEEAEAYRKLAEEFDHTQESLARILGKSRSHIANTLRLLTLPKRVKDYLNEGKLTAGHGRSLVGVEDPEGLAELIIQRNLSVRQAEALSKHPLSKNDRERFSKTIDPEQEILRNHLSDLLATPVEISLKGLGGKLMIPFRNPIELDQLIQKFNQIPTSFE